jgi:hypothetical protein
MENLISRDDKKKISKRGKKEVVLKRNGAGLTAKGDIEEDSAGEGVSMVPRDIVILD